MTVTASTRTVTDTGGCGQVLCAARRAYNVSHHRVDLTSANPVSLTDVMRCDAM